jgi:hypothetical protein
MFRIGHIQDSGEDFSTCGFGKIKGISQIFE